jgi:hypothetical protein
MLVLALVATVAAAQPSVPSRSVAIQQATASVRIISSARITPGAAPEGALVRDNQLRGADGSQVTSRIIEFP